MPRLADRCLESLRLPPHDTEMIVLDDNYWDFIGILFQTIPQWLFQKWVFYMFYDVVLSPQRIGDLWHWFHPRRHDLRTRAPDDIASPTSQIRTSERTWGMGYTLWLFNIAMENHHL